VDGVVITQLRHLVGELEEEQVGDLFDVVAVTDPRVFEDLPLWSRFPCAETHVGFGGIGMKVDRLGRRFSGNGPMQLVLYRGEKVPGNGGFRIVIDG